MLRALAAALVRAALAATALYVFSPLGVFLATAAFMTRQAELGLATTAAALLALGVWVLCGARARRLVAALVALSAVLGGCALRFRDYVPLDAVDVPPGSVALVTGGSSGIGKATVTALRARGFARVFVLSRRPPPAAAGVEHVAVDLSSIENARDAARRVADASGGRVDLVVLNAGVGSADRFVEPRTADNLPIIFGLNHVAQAALLDELLPLLAKSPLRRVTFVASMSSWGVPASAVDKPMHETSAVGGRDAYDVTKAWQVLYARALARRTALHATSLHPGAIATEIIDPLLGDAPAFAAKMYGTKALAPLAELTTAALRALYERFWEGIDVGAERVVYTALDRRVPNGAYVSNFGRIDVHTTDIHNATLVDVVYTNTQRAIAASAA